MQSLYEEGMLVGSYKQCISPFFTTLIKKYFLTKKCSLTAELSVSHNSFAGGNSCLDVDSYWLIWVIVTEGWGGCGNLLKYDEWSLLLLTLLFMNDFLVVCDALW